MNSERKRKPMTIREEYKNADVPLPNDMLNAANAEEIKIQEDEIAYLKHLKKMFKGDQ
jgi:hypothetical protein|tara:strand:+ start:382 stop:555 length:174 start_codon:yes stop_codon:yes gene_type:complete